MYVTLKIHSLLTLTSFLSAIPMEWSHFPESQHCDGGSAPVKIFSICPSVSLGHPALPRIPSGILCSKLCSTVNLSISTFLLPLALLLAAGFNYSWLEPCNTFLSFHVPPASWLLPYLSRMNLPLLCSFFFCSCTRKLFVN